VIKTVQIRKLSVRGGDSTTTVTLQQATEQVNEAIDKGFLVVDETTEEKRMLQNALGLTEDSKVAILPPVQGG